MNRSYLGPDYNDYSYDSDAYEAEQECAKEWRSSPEGQRMEQRARERDERDREFVRAVAAAHQRSADRRAEY
jgi:hypothetical protein